MPLNPRLSTAIALGKGAATLSRFLRRGGGTTMPGRVARAVEPNVVGLLARRLTGGTILVAGTNGKTTTAHLITHIMREQGHRPVHNRAGANLAAGIASALVEHADLRGLPAGDLGIFEVDEATVPRVVPGLAPRLAVFTNLFRDQLDRYGEIDYISGLWRAAGAYLGQDFVRVANADDPLVYDAVREMPGRLVTYGLDDDRHALPALEHTAEARYCYRCGTPYVYAVTYFGHMGRYRCPTCGMARPAPDVVARDIVLAGPDGASFAVDAGPAGSAAIRTRLPGLYNVYNILGAAAAALQLGTPVSRAADAVASFAPAFGRAERMTVDGREIQMLLVKNPAGFNEVLRTVLAANGSTDGQPDRGGVPLTARRLPVLLIAINDLIADGRDVSWLWDVDFEMLAGRVERVVVGGLRAEDMAVRLEYAGIPPDAIEVERSYGAALRRALAQATSGRLYILPTYTAMLAMRAVLERRGVVRKFWQ